MEIHNLPVRQKDLRKFLNLFKETESRYIGKPYWQSDDVLRVSFIPGNPEFMSDWIRLETEIREIDGRPGPIRKFFRRWISGFRNSSIRIIAMFVACVEVCALMVSPLLSTEMREIYFWFLIAFPLGFMSLYSYTIVFNNNAIRRDS